mmetsp:Transcript_58919/g.117903  ORF Transcript_58919/g.117903 Transcript_58919/m.117903 type:complete len:209 (+) Transcript_58919:46-672(+)
MAETPPSWTSARSSRTGRSEAARQGSVAICRPRRAAVRFGPQTTESCRAKSRTACAPRNAEHNKVRTLKSTACAWVSLTPTLANTGPADVASNAPTAVARANIVAGTSCSAQYQRSTWGHHQTQRSPSERSIATSVLTRAPSSIRNKRMSMPARSRRRRPGTPKPAAAYFWWRSRSSHCSRRAKACFRASSMAQKQRRLACKPMRVPS